MKVQTLRLSRIELTVTDLGQAEQFYTGALGFEARGRGAVEPTLAELYGAHQIRQVTLSRGEQTLVLQEFWPKGATYPTGSIAADQLFQHFALPVEDIGLAYAKLVPFGVASISSAGPQHLPERSGGAVAYKFRDPDGHPLELIQFPHGSTAGIDHSAIAAAEVERSIAFYRDQLGFRVAAQQMNTGVEQDRLDGLVNAKVGVVALAPAQSTPHVELLAYQNPRGRMHSPLQPGDIAATRLVLDVTGLLEASTRLASGAVVALVRDPDGHLLLLQEHGS